MFYSTYVVIDIETGRILDRDLIEYHGPVELCDKKAKGMAKNAANTATSEGTRYGSLGAGTRSTLEPELRREATSPTGFMPEDLNAMLVAGEQGAGGATGALSEEANLGAARSRNTGALSGVLGELARGKTRQLSENALGVQSMNAREKMRQKSEGLHGLEGLYGTDVGASLKEQGLVPEDIDAMLKANQSGWGKNLQDWARIATGGANAYANVKHG